MTIDTKSEKYQLAYSDGYDSATVYGQFDCEEGDLEYMEGYNNGFNHGCSDNERAAYIDKLEEEQAAWGIDHSEELAFYEQEELEARKIKAEKISTD